MSHPTIEYSDLEEIRPSSGTPVVKESLKSRKKQIKSGNGTRKVDFTLNSYSFSQGASAPTKKLRFKASRLILQNKEEKCDFQQLGNDLALEKFTSKRTRSNSLEIRIPSQIGRKRKSSRRFSAEFLFAAQSENKILAKLEKKSKKIIEKKHEKIDEKSGEITEKKAEILPKLPNIEKNLEKKLPKIVIKIDKNLEKKEKKSEKRKKRRNEKMKLSNEKRKKERAKFEVGRGEGKKEQNACLEGIRNYYESELPRKGSVNQFQISNYLNALEFERPFFDEKAELFAEWGLPLCFHLLKFSDIMEMISAILLEKKIVIFSDNFRFISAIVLSIKPLIRPFIYQSVIIPMLPEKMFHLLDAPVPFVVGTLSLPPRHLLPDDLVIVDLMSRSIRSPSPIPPLPNFCSLYPFSSFSLFPFLRLSLFPSLPLPPLFPSSFLLPPPFLYPFCSYSLYSRFLLPFLLLFRLSFSQLSSFFDPLLVAATFPFASFSLFPFFPFPGPKSMFLNSKTRFIGWWK